MKIKNNLGFNIEFLENGAIKSIHDGKILINLKKGTLFAKPLTNIYLRKLSEPLKFIPLIGPENDHQFAIHNNAYIVKGEWEEIQYTCTLQLSDKSNSWKWTIILSNNSGFDVPIDLIYVQDVGLKGISDGPVNEYYVSQYVERLIFEDSNYGKVVCCRQNMAENGTNPWIMLACPENAISACTDGMQFFGNSYRETGIPQGLNENLLQGNCAGESPIVALQAKTYILKSDISQETSFIGTYLNDHDSPSSSNDLKNVPDIIIEFNYFHIDHDNVNWLIPAKNLFNSSEFLPVNELSEIELKDLFGNDFSNIEKLKGKMLSFFKSDGSHVILKSKETLADRPHGHIIQANTSFKPDQRVMSTTCFATGVFNSHITQGNTNFNVLLSVNTSQFNLNTGTGQRVFVEIEGKYFLLGIPSAFELGLNHCRWIYKFDDHILQLRTWTGISAPDIYFDIKIIRGQALKFLITHDFDRLNNLRIISGSSKNEFIILPDKNSMVAAKFPESQFRINILTEDFDATNEHKLFNTTEKIDNLFVIETRHCIDFYMSFTGEISGKPTDAGLKYPDKQFQSDKEEGKKFWNELSCGLKLKGNRDAAAFDQILPWFGINAMTHFLTPYGLEQFSGAAWGTRDVSQGPIELLLNTGKFDEARKVLLTIFANQNPAGDWPQWWMFDSFSNIRAGDCHGDVYYWVIIALSNYIRITGDIGILQERTPYFDDHTVEFTVAEHIERLIKMITDSYLQGTHLVPFGGGDWNDSLQPVSKELASRLISSWTVEMNYQAFDQYKIVCEITGDIKKAEELKNICQNIKSDFNKYLIKDGIVAGYGLLSENGRIDVLLHPLDTITGIKYGILPMNRGIISGIFSGEQAQAHQPIIDKYLKGPDGARLMDKPLKYKGGMQKIFQRAESSTYFGREIGLMYIHEHIRYAESQAILGNADEFVKALRQAIPVDYHDIVPNSDIRQSNCYYTSSDAIFESRYEADEKYQEIMTGERRVKGGWRVYSSGPGIFVSLIINRLLGFRPEKEIVVLDPVIPFSMDGMRADYNFRGFDLEFRYKIQNETHSPKTILVNGKPLNFMIEQQQYRVGGAVIKIDEFISHLDKSCKNEIEVIL
jgi:1,2-beta-oligoglucan phosphorylase